MKNLTCTSCKINTLNLQGTVKFNCPNCSKVLIVRCPICRKIGVRYRCICGFEGPN